MTYNQQPTRNEQLRVGFLNINHLENKVDNLQQLISYQRVDIMCIAETFLTEKGF